MNDIMSLGSHRLWKRFFLDFISLTMDQKVLDLACGSGDISALLLKKYPNFENIYLSDQNKEMMKIAKKKMGKNKAKFFFNPAENLPFRNNFFDYVFLAFGLRNFSDTDRCLREIRRVLKNEGSFFCLEFSHINERSLRYIANLYLKIIPSLGSIFAQDRNAYEYLIESIKLFPNQIELTKKFEYIGFKDIECFDIFGGIASIHICRK